MKVNVKLSIARETETVKINIPKTDDRVKIEPKGTIIKVGDFKHYEASYQVTPRFEEQTLKTQNLVMDYDVQVATIPVERVANTSGGTTVIIG